MQHILYLSGEGERDVMYIYMCMCKLSVFAGVLKNKVPFWQNSWLNIVGISQRY